MTESLHTTIIIKLHLRRRNILAKRKSSLWKFSQICQEHSDFVFILIIQINFDVESMIRDLLFALSISSNEIDLSCFTKIPHCKKSELGCHYSFWIWGKYLSIFAVVGEQILIPDFGKVHSATGNYHNVEKNKGIHICAFCITIIIYYSKNKLIN